VTEKLPPHVRVLTEDVMGLAEDPDKCSALIGGWVDAVLSDMAPSTTGKKDVDAARSYNLGRAALLIAESLLTPGGVFVCKVFQGGDFEEFVGRVKSSFEACRIYKPQSTRKESKETYVIGIGRR